MNSKLTENMEINKMTDIHPKKYLFISSTPLIWKHFVNSSSEDQSILNNIKNCHFDHIILNEKQINDFKNLTSQRILSEKKMIYFNQINNKIPSHLNAFKNLKYFFDLINENSTQINSAIFSKSQNKIENNNEPKKDYKKDLSHLKNHENKKDLNKILKAKDIKQKIDSDVLQIKSNTIKVLNPLDVLDLKENIKNQQFFLEMKNQNLRAYDSIFIEKSFEVYKFLNSINKNMVKLKKTKSDQDADLVWVSVVFKTSDLIRLQEFFWVHQSEYHSLFDNLFFIQDLGSLQFKLWFLIPEHQVLNQAFVISILNRIKNKLEKQFYFVTFSYQLDTLEKFSLFSCRKYQMNSVKKLKKQINEFPVMHFHNYDEIEMYLKKMMNL